MRVAVRVYTNSRICGRDHFRELTKMENTKHLIYREYYIYNVEMLNLLFCGNISIQLLGGVAPFAYLCPWIKIVVIYAGERQYFARHACSGFFYAFARFAYSILFYKGYRQYYDGCLLVNWFLLGVYYDSLSNGKCSRHPFISAARIKNRGMTNQKTTISFQNETTLFGAPGALDMNGAAKAASDNFSGIKASCAQLKAKVQQAMLKKNEAYSRLAGFEVNNQTVAVIGFVVPLLMVATVVLATTAPLQAFASAGITGWVVYRFNRKDFKKGDEKGGEK